MAFLCFHRFSHPSLRQCILQRYLSGTSACCKTSSAWRDLDGSGNHLACKPLRSVCSCFPGLARVLLLVLAMRIGIPTWRGRISPVFDVAGNLLLVDAQEGRVTRREEAAVGASDLAARAKRVAELGTNVLICGALSWPLEAMLASAGVRVIPQTCGPVEDVLRAFLSGQLTQQAFLMPGCRGRRHRFRGGRRRGRPRA